MPKARINLDNVYTPSGRRGRTLGGRLYINKAKKYERTSPMTCRGHSDVVANRVCARGCCALVRGRRCKRPTCMDYRYCWTHLATIKHLHIAPSRVLKGEGLGLYALSSLKDLRVHGKDAIGAPIAAPRVRVFSKGDFVDEYLGEYLPDIDSRYPDRRDYETAVYTVQTEDSRVLDGIAAAGAMSYSNDPVNVLSLMRGCRTMRDFIAAYERAEHDNQRSNVRVVGHNPSMVGFESTRDICHGEEILWCYGSGYWRTPGMKRHLTGGGWGGR